MNAKQLFLEYPELDLVYQAGNSEAFADEEECKNYANHFNVSMKPVKREEVSGLPARKELKTKRSKKQEGEPESKEGTGSLEQENQEATGAVEPESNKRDTYRDAGLLSKEEAKGVEPENQEGTGAVESEK